MTPDLESPANAPVSQIFFKKTIYFGPSTSNEL
jgi:hypothetical protein